MFAQAILKGRSVIVEDNHGNLRQITTRKQNHPRSVLLWPHIFLEADSHKPLTKSFSTINSCSMQNSAVCRNLFPAVTGSDEQ